MSDRIILLTIDGLRASALGAYGNTARQTPAWDRLACESLLVEWALAESPDTASLCGSFLPLLASLGDIELVTDDASLTASPIAEQLSDTLLLPIESRDSLATGIAETAFAETFAHFADAVADTDRNLPQTLWLHSRGMTGPWDAPQRLVVAGVEEDDPLPEFSVTPASGPFNAASDQDAMFKAACRYGAQVAVLDACLEGWLDVFDSVAKQAPLHLIVLGTGGYALGEHGMIGRTEAGPYSESRHVPLLHRAPVSRLSHRFGTTPLSVAAGVRSLLEEHPGGSETALATAATAAVELAGESSTAVATSEWMLVASDEKDELYAKPDDRWEANDVASLEPGVVEDLRSHLSG